MKGGHHINRGWSVFRPNEFNVLLAEGIVEIQLSQGQVAIIDAEDSRRVLRYRWYAHKDKKANGSWYAWTKTRKRKIGLRRRVKLHRFILLAPEDIEVDHVDGDGLNNRRCNLRLATRKQNRSNTGPLPNSSSGFKGVTWEKPRSRNARGYWRAQIKQNGRNRHLGQFQTEEEAAAAYDAAASKAFGEFAWLNTK